ncbi:MAG: FAD:protein FMN transferase [Bacteroidales bacterium]|jgi:thiamine biosynthesis lipoprotein
MKYCKTTHFIFTSIFLLTLITSGCSRNAAYRNIEGFTQGTTYHITYSPDIKDSLDSFVNEILLNVDNSLSVYNDSSIISRLNRGDSVVIDSLFINVFNRSKEIYQISNGAFDISGAPLFDIWGFGFKNKERVTQTMIDSILPYVGMDKVNIEEGVLVKSDKRLTLNANAIAQGYTADVIAKEFDKLGIMNYLIEIGGEIFCKGVNSKGKEWTIGIDKPVEGNMIQGDDLQVVLSLTDKGLATSGNYRKFYEEGGEKFSHTIDPKTGYPVRHNLLSATVIAEDAMTADALATFFMVVGLDKAKLFLAQYDDVQAYLVYADGDKFKVFQTSRINIVK